MRRLRLINGRRLYLPKMWGSPNNFNLFLAHLCIFLGFRYGPRWASFSLDCGVGRLIE